MTVLLEYFEQLALAKESYSYASDHAWLMTQYRAISVLTCRPWPAKELTQYRAIIVLTVHRTESFDRDQNF